MSRNRDTGIIVVAAGRSARMGGALPKVWRELGGVTLVERALRTAAELDEVAEIALVVRPEDRAHAERAIAAAPPPTGVSLALVDGGAERRDSVRHGLAALTARSAFVLVHDAARPLASIGLWSRVLAAARASDAAVPALPVVDTLRRLDPAGRLATVPRDGLHSIQTPQGFRRDLLLRAHAQAADSKLVTDDAQLVELLGHAVVLVEGEPDNLKLTRPGDFELAARLLQGDRSVLATRVGLGHDLHPLAAGGPLRIGGVDLPAELHAVGHSDGDVLLHALTDALLGALALGDIGQHFSDRDPANRGRDSADFLRRAVALVAERGYAPAQVDATLHLERPKFAPHRESIVARVAALLALPLDAVSVKAKTGEGLDAVGRGEAIACSALVQVVPLSRSARPTS